MKSRISRIAQGEPYLADSCGALATTPAGYVWTVRICMDCWGIDMNAKAVVTTTDGEVRTLAVTVASKRKNTYMSPRRKTLHFFY